MNRTVRAKFQVKEITRYANNPGANVKLEAVTNAKGENEAFWNAPPRATLTMFITQDNDFLRLGDNYYLDFSFAPKF